MFTNIGCMLLWVSLVTSLYTLVDSGRTHLKLFGENDCFLFELTLPITIFLKTVMDKDKESQDESQMGEDKELLLHQNIKDQLEKDNEDKLDNELKAGCVDLRTNRFRRLLFFEYFKNHKSSCFECDNNTKPAQVISDFQSYYFSSARKFPLEPYYYGSCSGIKCEDLDPTESKLKCLECNELVAKSAIFRHLVTHLHQSVSNSQTWINRVCKYCLHPLKPNAVMENHVNKNHILLLKNGHCCRLCCKKFENEEETVIHMWKFHCESETPYKCPLCAFRTSFLYSLVDHFDVSHAFENILLCPICLKKIPSRYASIVDHIRIHLLGTDKLACGRCALRFADHDDFILHVKDKSLHTPRKSDKAFQPYTPPSGFPPILMAKDPNQSIPSTSDCNNKKRKIAVEENNIKEEDGARRLSDPNDLCFGDILNKLTPCSKLEDLKNKLLNKNQ